MFCTTLKHNKCHRKCNNDYIILSHIIKDPDKLPTCDLPQHKMILKGNFSKLSQLVETIKKLKAGTYSYQYVLGNFGILI